MHALSVADSAIPLHPRLTVVRGLDPVQRAAVADAVAGVVEDLTQLVAGRRGDDALVAELERAHAEVEEAEAAARRGLFPRRAARRRLAAAQALERALLEGMGYQSYNEARLARLGPVIDLVAEEAADQPVPMVIDDAVVTVEDDELEPVLRQLLGTNLQLIWLSDDPVVAAAAAALGAERAAVVDAGRSSCLHTV
jgi:hypothetical protein